MEGDGMAVITQLAIHDGTRQCGGLSRDADGTYAIDDERNSLHVELIAEAKKIVESGPLLRRYFLMEERATTCLVFGLAANGIARSIRLDGAFGMCGTLSRDGSVLRVGSVPLADSGSSTATLLSTKTARAGFLLATRDTNGCAVVELKASRIQRALLDADGSICGPVRDVEGSMQIGRDTIPNILGDALAADLRAAIGGTACLTVAITGNALTTGLKTTPAPSHSPTPAASTPLPTPSPIATEPSLPSATAAPTATPTRVPVVPALVDETPTSSTGYPAGPLFLGLLAVMAVVGVGFVGLRRSRAGIVPPEPSSSAALVVEPTVGSVESQAHPSVVSLTRREQEVLAMLFDGMSNKEIGSRLFISESTAGVHVSNIMAKLGARSRAEAATLALRMHLLTNDTFEH
jgi:DNA-binding CsgD family transcriptional regulator